MLDVGCSTLSCNLSCVWQWHWRQVLYFVSQCIGRRIGRTTYFVLDVFLFRYGSVSLVCHPLPVAVLVREYNLSTTTSRDVQLFALFHFWCSFFSHNETEPQIETNINWNQARRYTNTPSNLIQRHATNTMPIKSCFGLCFDCCVWYIGHVSHKTLQTTQHTEKSTVNTTATLIHIDTVVLSSTQAKCLISTKKRVFPTDFLLFDTQTTTKSTRYDPITTTNERTKHSFVNEIPIRDLTQTLSTTIFLSLWYTVGMVCR
jgi:hypothetical protein